MTPTPTPEVVVPRVPTDEMLRASLATDLPATYRTHLRHPFNGEKTALEVEKAIIKERKRWAAMLAASPQPVVAPSDLSGEDGLSKTIPDMDKSRDASQREALGPFAEVTGIPEWPDDEKVWLTADGNSLGFISLGDFRRAARALAGAE